MTTDEILKVIERHGFGGDRARHAAEEIHERLMAQLRAAMIEGDA